MAKSIQSENNKAAPSKNSADMAAKSEIKQETPTSDDASEESLAKSKKRGRSKKDDKDSSNSNRDSNGCAADSDSALASKVSYVGETQFLFSHIKQTMKVFVLT